MAVPRHVEFGEYQGKPTISYMRDEKDRWAVSMGARKVAAVIGNIKKSLQFLMDSGGDDGKEAVEEFQRQFTPVAKEKKDNSANNGEKKAKKDKTPASS